MNPLDGWTPSVPAGEAFELGTDAYRTTERLGMKELGSVGFVLVAGGLGERLGYKGAKVRLCSDLYNLKKYLSVTEFRQSLMYFLCLLLINHFLDRTSDGIGNGDQVPTVLLRIYQSFRAKGVG